MKKVIVVLMAVASAGCATSARVPDWKPVPLSIRGLEGSSLNVFPATGDITVNGRPCGHDFEARQSANGATFEIHCKVPAQAVR